MMRRFVELIVVFLCLNLLAISMKTASKYMQPRGRVVQRAAVNTTAAEVDQPHHATVLYLQDTAVLGGLNLSYYFPIRSITNSTTTAPRLMIGVLSTVDNRARRDTIRSTWAYNRTNVLFLIASSSSQKSLQFQNELRKRQDILYFDNLADAYRKIGYKVGLFFAAMEKHVSNYRYLFKTDDDSYLRVDAIQQQALEMKKDYVGNCNSFPINRDDRARGYMSFEDYTPDSKSKLKYPLYAQGAGYLLSKRLVPCVLHQMSHKILPIEDAMVGIYVTEACNGTCSSQEYKQIQFQFAEEKYDIMPEYLVRHSVKKPAIVNAIHTMVCCNLTYADPTSCGLVDCSKRDSTRI